MRTALLLVLSCVTTVMAQETLRIGEPVERQLSSNASQSYAIALNAGDYVALWSISTVKPTSRSLRRMVPSCDAIPAPQEMESASASLSRMHREPIE